MWVTISLKKGASKAMAATGELDWGLDGDPHLSEKGGSRRPRRQRRSTGRAAD